MRPNARIMASIVLFTAAMALLATGISQGEEFTFTENFSASVAENDAWVVGGQVNLLTFREGQVVFDSERGDRDQYRYLSLSPRDRLGGDFLVEFDFQITRLDHWNGLSLRVSALDGSWSAGLSRQQRAVGDEVVLGELAQGEKKDERSEPETTTAGTFRLTRKGEELTCQFKPDGGQFRTIYGPVKVGRASAGAGINFFSPKSTVLRAVLRSFRQTWTERVPSHPYPVYGRSKILADQRTVGGVYLIGSRNLWVDHETEVSMAPGGRAVYAMRAPLNVKALALSWESRGALKVSVTQLGTAETIELGQTLLWDQSPEEEPQMRSRGVSLNDFVTRMARRRDWDLPHQTANNIFFVSIEPATDQAVQVDSVTLSGSPLVAIEPFEPEYRCQADGRIVNGRHLLKWQIPDAEKDWWGQERLPAGSSVEMCGIPFDISPTVLGKQRSSVAMAVNERAGLLHLAHGAGPGIADDQTWVGTYLIVYEDGTTEPIFCTFEWNCGVYDSSWRKRGLANFTWWGPCAFTWADVHRLPKPGLNRGVFWDGIYVATYANPHPKKSIKEIIVYSPPARPAFTVLGITFTPPEDTVVALVEPDHAAIDQEKPVRADVMLWRPSGNGPLPNGGLWVAKRGTDLAVKAGPLARAGPFAFASFEIAPGELLVEPGSVRLQYRDNDHILASSSLLGWMPRRHPDDKPFYLTMIAGGVESRGEFERIRRLGYDALMTHMGWDQVQPEPAKFVWDRWEQAYRRIIGEGLKISIRNYIGIEGPTWLRDKMSTCQRSDGTKTQSADPADPAYADAVTGYYAAVAGFAARYPDDVIAINANYGLRFSAGRRGVLQYGPKHEMPEFYEFMQANYSLDDVNRRTGRDFKTWQDVTAQAVVADETGFLMSCFTRHHYQIVAALQRRVAEAIRKAGCKAHLTFNVAYHLQTQMGGAPIEEYIRIGRDFPPACMFHETSDRYCLSFFKWLATKRTFDLPYGDEGNQCPPCYEHNARAYQWMMMMQCVDAKYCQWYTGVPGSQNIAWLKPYYHLIFNAEYLPDPFCLAFSFESGFAEARSALMTDNDHKPIMSHYGLGNTLRALNLNADRYVMDHFPETDAKASPLMIDDVSRYIDDAFADRLEAFIRNGGTFVVSGDTDVLRDHKFLRRFNLELKEIPKETRMMLEGKATALPGRKWQVIGKGLKGLAHWENNQLAAAILPVGKGSLVIFARAWDQEDYDINLLDEFLNFCRDTLCRLGRFQPNVACDVINVDATPYRARDGAILVHLFNKRADEQTVHLRVRRDLVPDLAYAIDLGCLVGTASPTPVKSDGDYWQVQVTVPSLHSTVVRCVPKGPP